MPDTVWVLMDRKSKKPTLLYLYAFPTAQEAQEYVDDVTMLGGLGYSIVGLKLWANGGEADPVTLLDAVRLAKKLNAGMIYQDSKKWHHRGIQTQFTEEDHCAFDWVVLTSIRHWANEGRGSNEQRRSS